MTKNDDAGMMDPVQYRMMVILWRSILHEYHGY